MTEVSLAFCLSTMSTRSSRFYHYTDGYPHGYCRADIFLVAYHLDPRKGNVSPGRKEQGDPGFTRRKNAIAVFSCVRFRMAPFFQVASLRPRSFLSHLLLGTPPALTPNNDNGRVERPSFAFTLLGRFRTVVDLLASIGHNIAIGSIHAAIFLALGGVELFLWNSYILGL